MLGILGWGALISSVNPAAEAALKVLSPNAPMQVPFCLDEDHGVAAY